MLSTDPRDDKSILTEICQENDPKTRLAKAKDFFYRTGESGVPLDGEDIPLDLACKAGDLKIIQLFLEYKPEVNLKEIRRSLLAGIINLKKESEGESKNFSRVLKLTEAIFENVEIFNSRFPTGLGYGESLHLACFISRKAAKRGKERLRGDYHCNKKRHGLPASVILSMKRKRRCFVLIPRMSLERLNPNVIDFGSYKEIYPALSIDLGKRGLCGKKKNPKVTLAVQILPRDRSSVFKGRGISLMTEFSTMGKGLPQVILQSKYYSFKKESEREIVIQDLWGRGSLKSYARACLAKSNKPPLNIKSQILISYFLATGLAKLHGQNWVHGDVKLENCLRKKDEACVTDFDLTHPHLGQPAVWLNKFFYGTFPYAPPEQLKNYYLDEGAGQKGDMYALGLVLYQLYFDTPDWFAELMDYGNQVLPLIYECLDNHDWHALSDLPAIAKVQKILAGTPGMQEILEKQYALLDNLNALNELKKSRELTNQETYELLIYKLLHPDPEERLTASSFEKEITRLNKKIKP